MINTANIKYRLILITEDGKRHDITDFIENLGWEENERELAARISFTAKNDYWDHGSVSSLVKPGCLVVVLAEHGSVSEEVVRGTVTDWKPTASGSSDKLDITCYDELYQLQKSQDNIYFSAGITTRSAIDSLCSDWGIPVETYEGPDVTHDKLTFKTQSLANVLLDILEDAKKKGGGEAVIRARAGKMSVVRPGSNPDVYHFAADQVKTCSYKMSTSEMVTRVKVIGRQDDEGRSSVEATVNGLTQYGIRQKIYVREKDKSLEEAQTAAQEILNENGNVKEDMTIQAPDIPFIRKGDRVHLTLGTLDGYYVVKGIRHDADSVTMNLDLEKEKTEEIKENEVVKQGYDIGDEVYFKGGIHYISSYRNAKGYRVGPGRARITKKNGSGKAHPWHLVYINWSETHVYGWVDDGSFE